MRPVRLAESLSLHLIRHGEATKNLLHIHGAGDQALTPNGMAQMRAVSARIARSTDTAGRPFVFHQPEGRAERSATVIAAELGLTAIVIEELRGVRMGVTHGLSDEEVRVRYPKIADALDAWRAGESNQPPTVPGAEGLSAFATRIRSALDTVCAYRGSAGSALVVATTSTLNMLAHLLQNDGHLDVASYSFAGLELGSVQSWQLGNGPPLIAGLP